MARIADPDARGVILAHARELFVAEGTHNVSLRRIAKSVGVTPMALYRHFENKADLQVQLLREGFANFDRYLSRSESGANSDDRMLLLVEGFRDFALDEPAYFELMFLSSQTPEGLHDRRDVRRAVTPTFRRLVVAVEDCIADGGLEDEGAEDIALTLLAQAIGIVALHRSGTVRWSKAEAKRRFDRSFAATLGAYRPA